MTPIRAVKEMLGDEYYDLVEECMEEGWFFSNPRCCIGAMVYDEEWLERQNLNKELDKVWYVSFYAGDLRAVLDFIPFDLRWVCFKRNHNHDKIKIYDMKKLKQKLGGM